MNKPRSSNNKKPKESAKGITAISVRGYKSLYEECRLEIRPLTILAGANSSGKSSAIQPLLLLKQTLEANYDPGPLLLNGPNIRFNSTEQLFSKVAGKRLSDKFTIRIEADDERSIANTFKRHPKNGIDLIAMEYREGSRTTTLRPGMTFAEIYQANGNILNIIPYQTRPILPEGPYEYAVGRTKCFLDYELHLGRKKARLFPKINLGLSDLFTLHIRKLIHVPGLRGNPERTYKTTAIGFEFPGTFENYVASVINHWRVAKDHRMTELGSALEVLGLTWKVEAKQVDDTQVELRVGRLPHGIRSGLKDMVSIADVGFGVSQTLPVLVALLTAEAGQLVYLEQPEIHLHPRAQVALAQVLADAANRGVRVVAETHSSSLLLGVQSLVAEGKISPDKVKLHWFKRRNDGVTEVTSADLDKAGAFGDWPEDFADVALETESRYLNAVELRRGTQ